MREGTEDGNLCKDFMCDQNLDGGRLERWFKEDLALWRENEIVLRRER